jgi:hypothetical protein
LIFFFSFFFDIQLFLCSFAVIKTNKNMNNPFEKLIKMSPEELLSATKKMLEDKEAWKECVQKKESFSTLENRGMKLMKVK